MEAHNWVHRLLTQRAGDEEIGCNHLGDEHRRCTYAALPEEVQQIGDSLFSAGLQSRAHVALECENTLTTLLTFLSLLAQGHSVTLLPKDGEAPTPPFCRVRVMPQSATREEPLELVAHAHWNGAEANAVARVYVRTSGTTGAAKLAAYSLDALGQNARNCADRFALTARDRVVVPVALAHMFGLGAGVLPALLAGASIEVQAGANVLSYFERERIFEPTVGYLTPAFCQALVRARRGTRRYRLTVTAGDRIGEAAFRAYDNLHGTLVCLYGSTELGAIAASSPALPLEERAASVGHPMAGVTVQVAEEQGNGQAGELVVTHPFGFSGYADAHGMPLAAIEGAGHRTADLGRTLTDGRVQVLGRLDQRVKRDGKMVAFSDVEAALESLPGVQRAIVFADHTVAPGPRGSLFTACYEAVAGAPDVDAQSVRRASFLVLERHAVPDTVICVCGWPTLPSGKIDRRALAAQYRRA